MSWDSATVSRRVFVRPPPPTLLKMSPTEIERVDHALFGRELGARMHVLALAFPRLNDGDFDEIAHDLLDVPADIPDLGEFGRFHLEEGRAREPGQAA